MNAPHPHLTCDTCIGACCRAPVDMHLTNEEWRRHRATMKLELIAKPRNYPQVVQVPRVYKFADGSERTMKKQVSVKAGYGFFLLQETCGYLGDDNRCTIYERRPGCCRGFEMSSQACHDARIFHDLDGGIASLAVESDVEPKGEEDSLGDRP